MVLLSLHQLVGRIGNPNGQSNKTLISGVIQIGHTAIGAFNVEANNSIHTKCWLFVGLTTHWTKLQCNKKGKNPKFPQKTFCFYARIELFCFEAYGELCMAVA